MKSKSFTSKTLIEELKENKNSESWSEFCKIYTPYIYTIVRNMRIKPHEIDDLVQKIILKAWGSIESLRYTPGRGALRSWLRAISRNCTITYINQMKKHKFIEDIENYDFIVAPEVEQKILDEWQEFVSLKAWNNIKDDFSVKVCNIFLELSKGRLVADLAEEYNLKLNTVYQYRNRVKDRLYKEIRKLDYELS
jgi:RNA polymerase sigma factor (sigma-70 family)